MQPPPASASGHGARAGARINECDPGQCDPAETALPRLGDSKTCEPRQRMNEIGQRSRRELRLVA